MGRWTRRGFIGAGLVAGGAFVIGVAIRPGHRAPGLARYVAGDGDSLINAWVKIDQHNKVTAIIPHSEMGQGAQTALTQMLADELDASWDDVSFIEAPAEDDYANYPLGRGAVLGAMPIPKILSGTVDGVFLAVTKSMHLQITGGSTSIRATGVHGMRVAGAAAKTMLREVAAEKWNVKVEDVIASEGILIHQASNQKATFADFATFAAEKTPPTDPVLKTPDQFTIMGKHMPRFDIPSKVDGSAIFGIDVVVDGMKYAAIKAAPVFGSSLEKFDASKAEKMPGVLKIVELEDAVAVVANGYWLASKALAAIAVTWSASEHDNVSSVQLFEQFQNDMVSSKASGNTHGDVNLGDAEQSFESAERIIERKYKVPYLAHACMEPMNAVAHVRNGECDLWTGSQNPLGFKYDVATALELDPENVRVTNYFMGGGFGRRATPDAAIQAAKISLAAGVPVKLIWSREEDVQHDHYRPAVASNFRGVLGEDGLPIAWENQYVDKHEPAEAPHIPYAIANQNIFYSDSPTHIPFGPWRSVDHSQHGFFVESFIDELAVEAKQDPYQYRRKLLSAKPRLLNVLDRVAKEADWDTPIGKHRGRGIALQESFGTVVAEVVEVSVRNGKIVVDRVVIAVDPGFAVAPDGLTAQMESGVVYGLTAALYGEVSIENGRVKEANFDTYPMVRMADAPKIETHIINSLGSWGGAGEPGTPGTAPALVNAIYAATGTRVRELPVSKYEFNVQFEEQEKISS